MGTNYYWKLPPTATYTLPTGVTITPTYDDDPRIHIGKISSAGYYCTQCDVTLCKSGNSGIHYSKGEEDWWDHCPKCVKPRSECQRVSSFTWAQEPDLVITVLKERKGEFLIVDECGMEMECEYFLNILMKHCPIQFTKYIGEYFS